MVEFALIYSVESCDFSLKYSLIYVVPPNLFSPTDAI